MNMGGAGEKLERKLSLLKRMRDISAELSRTLSLYDRSSEELVQGILMRIRLRDELIKEVDCIDEELGGLDSADSKCNRLRGEMRRILNDLFEHQIQIERAVSQLKKDLENELNGLTLTRRALKGYHGAPSLMSVFVDDKG